MNKFTTAALDAEWELTADVDLVRNHFRLLGEMHHDDDATPEELTRRIRTARKYIRRSCLRFRGQSRKLTAFTQRLLLGSTVFSLWAIALAALLG